MGQVLYKLLGTQKDPDTGELQFTSASALGQFKRIYHPVEGAEEHGTALFLFDSEGAAQEYAYATGAHYMWEVEALSPVNVISGLRIFGDVWYNESPDALARIKPYWDQWIAALAEGNANFYLASHERIIDLSTAPYATVVCDSFRYIQPVCVEWEVEALDEDEDDGV